MEKSSSTFCQTYIFFTTSTHDLAQTALVRETKVVAAAAVADAAAAAADAAEMNWKHKVIPYRGDLISYWDTDETVRKHLL